MKRYLLMALMVVWMAVGCLGHTPRPFHYIAAPSGYTAIPLKVIPIYVDKNFGEADQLAIDDAITQWNFALNGYIQLKVISTNFDMEPEVIRHCLAGGCWMFLKVNSDNPMVTALDASRTDGKKYWTLAWANAIGGNRMYLIRDRLQNLWMTGVTLHEMGHLLGAEHDEVYLMQPHYNWEDYRCVDYEALKRVAEFQHLPLGRLNYCVYGANVQNLPIVSEKPATF